MDQTACGSCIYYRQHYTFDHRKIFRVYCGHCTCLKVKAKKPDSKICERYVRKTPDENGFVTREYLSKTLLEYMLNLELLPVIYDTQVETEKESDSGRTGQNMRQ